MEGTKVWRILQSEQKFVPSLKELKSISQLSRKKKKKHDKIVLLAKTKLNTIEVLVDKTLVDSYINHDEFVSVSNVLRMCFNVFLYYIEKWKRIVSVVRKIMRTKILV